MEIRKPHQKDRASISSILARTMSAPYQQEMQEELTAVLEGKHLGLIVCEQGEVLGYITCHKTMKTYKVETLAVDPAFQKRGLGRALLGYLEKSLVAENSFPVVINVVTEDSVNDPVQEFYKRCGYQVSGMVSHECRFGDRQVHLSKIIDFPPKS